MRYSASFSLSCLFSSIIYLAKHRNWDEIADFTSRIWYFAFINHLASTLNVHIDSVHSLYPWMLNPRSVDRCKISLITNVGPDCCSFEFFCLIGFVSLGFESLLISCKSRGARGAFGWLNADYHSEPSSLDGRVYELTLTWLEYLLPCQSINYWKWTQPECSATPSWRAWTLSCRFGTFHLSCWRFWLGLLFGAAHLWAAHCFSLDFVSVRYSRCFWSFDHSRFQVLHPRYSRRSGKSWTIAFNSVYCW